MSEPRPTVTPQEASRVTGQSIATLARYHDAGRLDGYRLPSGHRRYYLDAVQAIVSGSATQSEGRSVPPTTPHNV